MNDEKKLAQQEPLEEQVKKEESVENDDSQENDEIECTERENISFDDLHATIERLTEELAAAKDQSLRAAAEVDNIRRRSSNEQINIRKYAVEGFASELLAVKDSLDLAEQVELSADNKDVIDKMHEGLVLTLKQLDRAFEKFSIEIISPEKGEKLDPELHQAMTVQPTDEVDNNCILSVIQKGYKLHDRLLRPAMVIIARKAEQKNNVSEQE